MIPPKAGLVAAEKNKAAVVLVSMVAGPDLGARELARYLFRCPFLLDTLTLNFLLLA